MAADPNPAARAVAVRDEAVGRVLARVADPDQLAGGGVIAAVTLAGAAASVELVLQLAARRKSLEGQRAEILAMLAEVQALRGRALAAADQDAVVFADLMAAQAQLREADSEAESAARRAVEAAYAAAADAPIELAEDGMTLVDLVRQGMRFATRFIVSDIGAAAVLARAAAEVALLTADANLSYLPSDSVAVATLRARVATVRTTIGPLAEEVRQLALAKLEPRRKPSAS